MILFSNEPTNNWIIGQMFTQKYNFCFHNDNKQIQFYKKINHGAKKILNLWIKAIKYLMLH